MDFKSKLPKSPAQIIFLALLSIVIVINLITLSKSVDRIRNFKKMLKYQNIGYQFQGLEDFIKDVPYIGYFTDGDIKDKEHEKNLTTAQYTLAPTVLDYNNTDHKLMLLVCTSEFETQKKLQELGAEALLRNPFGIVLAKKKR